MIRLTAEWTKSGAARAVPGSYWDSDAGAWVLDDDCTPRAAAVALQLFPQLQHEYPELVELRASLLRDVSPVDYATEFWDKLPAAGRKVFGTRVAEQMAARGMGWHDYQVIDGQYGTAVLREHGGYYLGWDRGKGKTLATAGYIDTLDCKATLVVAPNTSKTSVWADELAWACPWLEIFVLPNDKAKRELMLDDVREAYDDPESDFALIVHYEALGVIAGTQKGSRSARVLDGWKKLGIEWDLKVLDEGHRISNHTTIQARAAVKVPARMRLLLSGSTFQNRWEELYGQLRFLYPDRYKSKRRDFCHRFLDYVENGWGEICVGVLPDQVDALRDELGRIGSWRRKQNLAQAETVLVDLSPEQQRVYDDLAETLLAELPSGERIKTQAGVSLLTRLRQVASGLELLTRQVTDSTKLDKAIATISRHWKRGDDYVVFVWYKESARALAARLAELGIESWVITGDVPQTQRTDMIRRFTKGERRVMIGTIPTMGESVNLQRANHVIMVDRSWNPALNQQAVDRVDRQGQQRDVYLTHIVARDTVDELVVLPSLTNKEALRSMIFGHANQEQAA